MLEILQNFFKVILTNFSLFQVVLLAAIVLVEVEGDAFFNLFKSSGGGGGRKPAHIRPRQPGRTVKSYGGSSFGKSNNYPSAYSGKKPQFSKKPAYPQKAARPYGQKPRVPSYPRTKPARAPAPGHKLDYSGWKPIGFDEKKPAAAASASATSYTPDVVTVDFAIANAPKAQSDSIHAPAPVYSAPPPEPIVQQSSSYAAPAPAPALAQYQSLPALSKPQAVTSTYGSPVPAVPYIPSTADLITSRPQYKPKKYSQTKSKPQYKAPQKQQQYASPKPQYKAPAPAPAYKAPAPSASYNSPAPVQNYNAPAPAPAYRAPVLASAPSYSAPAPTPSYSAPAPAPAYSAPAASPSYSAPTPSYSAPAPANSYSAPAPAPKYEAPASSYRITTSAPRKTKISSSYNVPRPAPTKAPVVLPSYTPAPSAYDPNSFGGEEFPIISLITGDSDVAEEDQFVAFSFGGEYNAPVKYQNTREASQLAEEVSSGSVYVQNPAEGVSNDELYYIYYQDPELDPSYGSKVENKRNIAPEARPILSTLDASGVKPIAPANDIPLYDYEDAGLEYVRDSRQPQSEEYFSNYKNIGGHSSVSFSTEVNGKESGFSYHL